MMTYDQIVKKMGKQKAVEFIVANRNTNEKTGHEKTCGIRGRIKYHQCQHGIWTIDNYEPKPCLKCMGVGVNLKRKEFRSYFNFGLGAYVESRSEEKRLAKTKGLVEAG